MMRTYSSIVASIFHSVGSIFRSRANLTIENLALRQQLAILKEKGPRPRLTWIDRGFWVLLRKLWPKWSSALVIVKPETVVHWHRRGFRWYWRRKSRPLGRPRANVEIRSLIRRMARENPTWGAPRIHKELLALGFDISERTISRYMPRREPDPDKIQTWKTFLKNHRELITAIRGRYDFWRGTIAFNN
jgi:putative transposase